MKKRTVAAVELLVMQWEANLEEMRRFFASPGRIVELEQRIAELKDTLGWDKD